MTDEEHLCCEAVVGDDQTKNGAEQKHFYEIRGRRQCQQGSSPGGEEDVPRRSSRGSYISVGFGSCVAASELTAALARLGPPGDGWQLCFDVEYITAEEVNECAVFLLLEKDLARAAAALFCLASDLCRVNQILVQLQCVASGLLPPDFLEPKISAATNHGPGVAESRTTGRTNDISTTSSLPDSPISKNKNHRQTSTSPSETKKTLHDKIGMDSHTSGPGALLDALEAVLLDEV